MTNRNFITLPPMAEMSPIELYIQLLYFSAGTMGAVAYGDIISFTLAEQLFHILSIFWARIFLGFMFAETAIYLQQLHYLKLVHY